MKISPFIVPLMLFGLSGGMVALKSYGNAVIAFGFAMTSLVMLIKIS